MMRTSLLSLIGCRLVARRTDDDRRHAVGIDAPLESAFHLLRRHALDILREIVEVREREAVEADHSQVLVDFAVAVDAQWKAADDVLLRRRELFRGRALRD